MHLIYHLLRFFFRPLTVVLLGAIAAWAFWWIWPERPTKTVIIDGLAAFGEIRLSPHARYAVVEKPENRRGIIRFPSGEQIVPPELMTEHAEFLSNDRVLLHNYKDVLRLVDLTNGKMLCDLTDYTVDRWSASGSIIVCQSTEPLEEIVVIDGRDGNEIAKLRNAKRPVSIDACGTHVVTLVRDDPHNFVIWDAHSGREVKRVHSSGGDLADVVISHDGRKVVSVNESAYLWDVSNEGVATPVCLVSQQPFDCRGFDTVDHYIIEGCYSSTGLWDITGKLPRRVDAEGLWWFDPPRAATLLRIAAPRYYLRQQDGILRMQPRISVSVPMCIRRRWRSRLWRPMANMRFLHHHQKNMARLIGFSVCLVCAPPIHKYSMFNF